MGEWDHFKSHSEWNSHHGYRPLPRRERSVRSDYNVLDGKNRITVMSNGWVHEQDNLKRVVSDSDSTVFVNLSLTTLWSSISNLSICGTLVV